MATLKARVDKLDGGVAGKGTRSIAIFPGQTREQVMKEMGLVDSDIREEWIIEFVKPGDIPGHGHKPVLN